MSHLGLSSELLPSNQIEDFSEYVFTTKYARYDFKKKRRETWDEAVDRVRDMHLHRYASKGINDDINWAFEQVRQRKVLPSMRSMQFGGEPIIVNDARMYNCAYSHADRPRFFSEAFWMLLSGVGAGFSVQKQHVAKLPKLVSYQSPDEKSIMTHTVEDTIEGWADALDILMSTFFQGNPISGREVFFDFSKIRRKGSWLKTSGGRAPGATPLRIALKRIKRVLREAIESGQRKLRPIQVYDIVMMAADAVLSGGIRRSATIAIFSYDDHEMMTAKTFCKEGRVLSKKRKDGSWLTDYGVAINLKNDQGEEPEPGELIDISWSNIMPWRARSNNSVALLRNECTLEQFKQVIGHTKKYGEPGFVFLDNLDYGYNPCLTGDMRLLTEHGYKTLQELWIEGGSQQYDKYKTPDEYGYIKIVNSNGVVKATNVYKTSDSIPIYEVRLHNGQVIKATANHKFLRTDGNNVERVELKDLIVGDSLSVVDKSSFGTYHNPDYALLAGWVTGDGSLSKNSAGLQRAHVLGRMMAEDGCKHGSPTEGIESTKHLVPHRIWLGDKETICAYLRGIFSADGSVQFIPDNKSFSVRLWQADNEYLREVQILLSQIGIQSKIYKDRYELVITKNSIKKFSHLVGFIQDYKNSKLKHILETINLKDDEKSFKIKSIELIGNQPTYCLTEFSNNEIVINGFIVGNCVEIGLYPICIKSGQSGWQVCNLTEINGGVIETKEDWADAVKAAAIIGTLQAGYTYFHYLTDTSRDIIRRERLLGVSVTGWMENPDLLLNPKLQREMAKYAVKINQEYAEKIGIEPAARVTCTKPAGNSAAVLGTASGHHAYKDRYIFRRCQGNSVEKPLQYFKLWNPQAVEKSVWGENDEVITFCIQAPETAMLSHELTAIEFLEKVKSTVKNWVWPGTANPDSSPGLKHNVSNTISVGEDEWDEVAEYLYKNREYFSGVSLLSKSGDKTYEQAPMESVSTKEDIEKWNNLVKSFSKVNWQGLSESEDYTSHREIIACAGGKCEV